MLKNDYIQHNRVNNPVFEMLSVIARSSFLWHHILRRCDFLIFGSELPKDGLLHSNASRGWSVFRHQKIILPHAILTLHHVKCGWLCYGYFFMWRLYSGNHASANELSHIKDGARPNTDYKKRIKFETHVNYQCILNIMYKQYRTQNGNFNFKDL